MLKNILVSLMLTAAVAWQPVSAGADVSLELDPNNVRIGTFYNGTTIEATGLVPADAEILVRVSGAGEELHLKKKGKVGGLLWMNTGDVTFEHAPRAYMLNTTTTLADRLEQPAIGLGFIALEKQVEISATDEAEKTFLFQEFLKLKKKAGLYIIDTASTSYAPAENGMKSFHSVLTIPPRMTPGAYTVELFAVTGDQVVGSTTNKFNIKQIGFPAQLSDLAFNKSIFYGVMSVIIALGAGLLMGTLFKGKGGAH